MFSKICRVLRQARKEHNTERSHTARAGNRPYLPYARDPGLFSEALLGWFREHARPLPWRDAYTPYGVWISEIMLQQTQMDRGVAYYRRWMERFPDIAALASASEEEVLRAWEGLGYYSRARNVLKAARAVMGRFAGRFPETVDELRSLPGVGPYTAAAIASIAFGRDVPCVDTNVTRVLARVFDIDTPIGQTATRRRVEELAARVLPPGRAREHNQALMELGALVCAKTPRCEACPVARHCDALRLGIVADRPVIPPRAGRVAVTVATGVLRHAGRIYIQRRCPDDVWGGLWEFAGGCVEPGERPRETVVREYMEETGLAVRVTGSYGLLRHGYTRYDVTLHCFALELAGRTGQDDGPCPSPPALTAATDFLWETERGLEGHAMPAAHRRLADRLLVGEKPAPLPADWPAQTR